MKKLRFDRIFVSFCWLIIITGSIFYIVLSINENATKELDGDVYLVTELIDMPLVNDTVSYTMICEGENGVLKCVS